MPADSPWSLRRVPPLLWSLFLGNLTASISTAIYFPLLALFMREKYGVRMQSIGLLFFAGGVLAAAGAIAGGEWSDRTGRRRVMVFALAGRAAITAGLAACAVRSASFEAVASCSPSWGNCCRRSPSSAWSTGEWRSRGWDSSTR